MGSPVIANEKVYVTGIPDTLSGVGRLHVLDMEGRLLWTKDYGTDFTELFAGARSTPTVAGNLIYLESGNGVVYCLNATTGELVWSVDFFRDLLADSVQFGFSESLLIDGDRIYCTPGGSTNNMVALNRFTGEKIWSATGSKEMATYSSPVVFDHNGNRIIVNLTASSILGISADNGEVLWRFHQFQDNKIHANTPIYDRGEVLISSASRKDSSGLVMLKLSPDGRNAEIKWRTREIINLMGGAIMDDSTIYLSTYMQPKWYCVDRETGKIRYISKDLGGGVVISADGLLYCYTERDGEMALVEATPEQMKVISRFRVPSGTAQHWAHPVISHGKLFIRHGDALMVYQISAG
jgi:outer membrane protein assembly factor BamB